MRARAVLGALAGAAARRPRAVLAAALIVGVIGAALALTLGPTAATSTFVSSSSSGYKATQYYYSRFGEEPINVLVEGNLQQLVLSSDLERLIGLEGCLSGTVPAAALAAEGGAGGPCGQLDRLGTVKVVFGPGTFINEAAQQIDQELSRRSALAKVQAAQAEHTVYAAARARGLSAAIATELGKRASAATLAAYKAEVEAIALQYGLTSVPTITNGDFISALVFDSTKKAGTPKRRFAYLFPDPESALISVRLKGGVSEQQRIRTIAVIRSAVGMSQWQLQHGERYLITGEPVIVSDLTESITHAIELLLIAVLLVMAGALGLIFLGRPRLLPLALALLAAAVTFGGLAIVGGSLSIATIAVLPVLVGLAVDYSIQLQSRVAEAQADLMPSGIPTREQRVRAIVRGAHVGAPTIATAGAASAAAILVLLLSPVPMVRGFGVLLVIGLLVALLCAISVGAAALALVGPPRPLASAESAAGRVGSAWRGARELLLDNPLTRLLSRIALGEAVRRPERVLLIGLALALVGWGVDTQTGVETDITKLVPQSLSSLSALRQLESRTGIGGQIDVMVRAPNVATPRTIQWMSRYESNMLGRFGYSEARGCADARLCPLFSLPDLFTSPQAASGAAPTLTQAAIDSELSSIPEYFSQAVITPDRRVATLVFGVRLQGLSQEQQNDLVTKMTAALHPPPGVDARLVGLTMLAAQSGAKVASPWRRILTLIVGIAAVALVLTIAFRGDRRRVLAPLVPIVLATGWSALILYAVRVPLNPMSVTLGPLVIAVSTEFSVLLAERHRQERIAGHDTVQALRRTYSRTGAAVAASGTTAIAGFGVLALADIRMLRDFGLVTLIDLTVSLLGVLVALPAALVIAQRSETKSLAGGRSNAAARPGLGRPGHEPA